jgi:molecular chaperone DnaJ
MRRAGQPAPAPHRTRAHSGRHNRQHIRVARLDDRGLPGDGPHELLVRVHVRPARFGRRGRDLTVTVPITYPAAVLGTVVPIPTLAVAPIKIRVPPGSTSGRVLRVPEHGVPSPDGRGDLLVTTEIARPVHLDPDERAAVEALARAMAWSPRTEEN